MKGKATDMLLRMTGEIKASCDWFNGRCVFVVSLHREGVIGIVRLVV